MQPNNGLTERYPLDADKLKKGDLVTVETLEHVIGEKRETNAYNLGRLTIRDYIEKAKAAKGEIVCVKIEGNGLRILTDPEAVAYTEKRNEAHVRGIKSTFRRMVGIDTTNLEVEERNRLAANKIKQSLHITAIHLVNRETSLNPYTDKTPKLVGKDDSK